MRGAVTERRGKQLQLMGVDGTEGQLIGLCVDVRVVGTIVAETLLSMSWLLSSHNPSSCCPSPSSYSSTVTSATAIAIASPTTATASNGCADSVGCIEGSLVVPLPSGGTVCGYSIEVDGVMREASIVETEAAAVAYEAERDSGSAAAISSSVASSNIYKCKVFPIRPGQLTKICVRYTHQMRFEKESHSSFYALPFSLRSHSTLRTVEMHARVDCVLDNETNREITPNVHPVSSVLQFVNQGNWMEASLRIDQGADSFALLDPLDFFISDVPQYYIAVESSRPLGDTPDPELFFMCACTTHPEILPQTTSYSEDNSRIGILWDASYSRAEGSHSSEIAVIEALLQQTPARIDIFSFSVDVHSLADDLQQATVGDLLSSLLYTGATDYARLATWCQAKAREYAYWVLFSDGVDSLSMGNSDDHLSFGCAIHCVFNSAATSQYSDIFLRKVAQRNSGKCVNLSIYNAEEAVEYLLAKTSNPKITLEKCCASVSQTDVSPFEPYILYGKLNPSASSASFLVDFTSCGIDQRVPFSLPCQSRYYEDQFGTIIGRRWALMEIEKLQRNRSNTLALCRTYNLCGEGFSFLVLLTLDQYLTHKISPPLSVPNLHAEYWRITNTQAHEANYNQEKQKDRAGYIAAILWKNFLKWATTEYQEKTPHPEFLHFQITQPLQDSFVEKEIQEPPKQVVRRNVPLHKYYPSDFAPDLIPRSKAKNKAPAPVQITAQQILREAREMQTPSQSYGYAGHGFKFDEAELQTTIRDLGKYPSLDEGACGFITPPYGTAAKMPTGLPSFSPQGMPPIVPPGILYGMAPGGPPGMPPIPPPQSMPAFRRLSHTFHGVCGSAPLSSGPPAAATPIGRGATDLKTFSDRTKQDIDDRAHLNFLNKKSWQCTMADYVKPTMAAREKRDPSAEIEIENTDKRPSWDSSTPRPPSGKPIVLSRWDKIPAPMGSRIQLPTVPEEITSTSFSELQKVSVDLGDSIAVRRETPRFHTAHKFKLVQNPDGSLQRAAISQAALERERRALLQNRVRSTVSHSLPENYSFPWEDTVALPVKRRRDVFTPGSMVPSMTGSVELSSPDNQRVLKYQLHSSTQCAPTCSNLLSHQGIGETGDSLMRKYRQLYEYIIQSGQSACAFIIGSALHILSIGSSEDAYRILSNIAEHSPGEMQPLGIMATVCQALGLWTQALTAWKAAFALRKSLLQYSYHTAVASLRGSGIEKQEILSAVSALQSLSSGESCSGPKYLGLQVTAKLDLLSHTLSLKSSAASASSFSPLLHSWDQENSVELDLRVILWTTSSDSDVELSVSEPSGELCSPWHNHTSIGGRLSGTSPVGLGPFEYTLRKAVPGTYRVQARAKFIGNNNNNSSTSTEGGNRNPVVVVGCRCVLNYGRTSETELNHFAVMSLNSSVLLVEFTVVSCPW